MKALYKAALAAQMAQEAEGNEEKNTPAPVSWYIYPAIRTAASKEIAATGKLYALLPAGKYDIEKVISSYQLCPVPGQNIKRVQVIYNPRLNRKFGLELNTLNAKHNKPAFNAHWRNEQGQQGAWRDTTHQLLEVLAKPHRDVQNPHVKILPMWHATNAQILPSLFETGFANLAMVDTGFFGKGIYSAAEARYSQTVYGKMYATPALLMNWVASFSAYPVIDGDMGKLQGGANLGNYDAHFIPVRPLNPQDPDESVFYPCRVGEKATYTEMVVFQSAQCLPRYLVELQSDLLKTPQEIEEAKLKHAAEQVQKANAKQQADDMEKQLVQQALEAAQKQAALLEKEQEKEKIKAEQIEAEKVATNLNGIKPLGLNEEKGGLQQAEIEDRPDENDLLFMEDKQPNNDETIASNNGEQLLQEGEKRKPSLVNPRKYVTEHQWIVSLLNTDGVVAGLKGAGHVKMLIEGIEKSSHHHFFKFYFRICDIIPDLVEDDNSLINKKGRIIDVQCLKTVPANVDYKKSPSRSYIVTPLDAKAIVASVERDRAICQAAQTGNGEYPLYQSVGTHHVLSDAGMGHNSASWCVEKLALAGIDLTNRASKAKKVTSPCVIC